MINLLASERNLGERERETEFGERLFVRSLFLNKVWYESQRIQHFRTVDTIENI